MNLLYALSIALVGYWSLSLYSAHARRTRERRHRLEQRRKAGIPDSDSRPFDVAREDALRRRETHRAQRRLSQDHVVPPVVNVSSPFSSATASARRPHPTTTPLRPSLTPSRPEPMELAASPSPYAPVSTPASPLPLSTSNLRQVMGSASVKRGVPSNFSEAALPAKHKKESFDVVPVKKESSDAAPLKDVRTIIREIPPVGPQRKRRPAESIDGDEQKAKRSRQDGEEEDAEESDSDMLSVISDEEDEEMGSLDGEAGNASLGHSESDESMDGLEAYPHGLKRTLASAAVAEDSHVVDTGKQRRVNVAKRIKSAHTHTRRRERSSTPASAGGSSPPPSKRAYTPSSPYRPSTLASKHVPSASKSSVGKRSVDTADDHEIGSQWTDLNGLRWQMGEDGVARREAEYFERLPRFDMPKDSLHPDRHELEWRRVRGWVDEERFEELKREKRLGWQEEERKAIEEKGRADAAAASTVVTPSRVSKPRRSVDPGALFSVPQGPPLRFSPAMAASPRALSPSPSRAGSVSPAAAGRLALTSTSTSARPRLGTPRSAMLDQAQKARREETIMRALREKRGDAGESGKLTGAGTGAAAAASSSAPIAPAASTGFAFGSAAKAEPASKPVEAASKPPTFSFGAAGGSDTASKAADPKPVESKPSSGLFTFGAPKSADASAVSTKALEAAAAPAKPTLSFSPAPTSAPSSKTAATSSTQTFTFGASTTAATAPAPAAAPAVAAAPAAAAAPTFSFGAPPPSSSQSKPSSSSSSSAPVLTFGSAAK